MARGGIYTADLAAKERGIKISGAGKEQKSHQKLWRAAAARKHDLRSRMPSVFGWSFFW